jgi:hypothetical protein
MGLQYQDYPLYLERLKRMAIDHAQRVGPHVVRRLGDDAFSVPTWGGAVLTAEQAAAVVTRDAGLSNKDTGRGRQ